MTAVKVITLAVSWGGIVQDQYVFSSWESFYDWLEEGDNLKDMLDEYGVSKTGNGEFDWANFIEKAREFQGEYDSDWSINEVEIIGGPI